MRLLATDWGRDGDSMRLLAIDWGRDGDSGSLKGDDMSVYWNADIQLVLITVRLHLNI